MVGFLYIYGAKICGLVFCSLILNLTQKKINYFTQKASTYAKEFCFCYCYYT